MNIEQFFQSQSPQHLSQIAKSKIYKEFLVKRERKSSVFRWSLVSKKLTLYSTIGIFIIASVFVYPFQDSSIRNLNNVNNQAMAQTIGSIIESTGTFSIFNNGRDIQSKIIQLKDIINIDKWSKLKILISDSFQTEIIWPARFEIVPVWQGDRATYNLKFMNGGDFVSINNENQTNNNEINIETVQGVIIKNQTKAQNQKVSFTVIWSSSTKSTTILNKSDVSIEASTTHTGDSSEKSSIVTISPTQITELTKGDTEDLHIVESKELEAVDEKEIIAQASSLLNEETPKTTTKATPESKELEIPTEPEANKLNWKQTYLVEQNLYKSFVENDIENILMYHFIGNKQALDISRNNLSNRIERVADIMEIEINKSSDSINWIINNIDKIEKIFSEKYATRSKALLSNLIVARNWLQLSNNYNFWSYKDIQLSGWVLSLEEIPDILNIKKGERKYKFR